MHMYWGVGCPLPALVGHKYISPSVMPWPRRFPAITPPNTPNSPKGSHAGAPTRMGRVKFICPPVSTP